MPMRFHKLIFLFLIAAALSICFSHAGFAQQTEGKYQAKIFATPVDAPQAPAPGTVTTPSVDPNRPNTPGTIGPVQPADDLSPKGKLIFAFKKSYLSPTAYFYPAISTLRQEMSEVEPPFKSSGDKTADHFARYGINFLTASNKSMLTNGIYPALFKQNPHYVPSGRHGFGARTMYAISRVFITQGDDGNSQFNASLFAGDLSASALANVYERNYFSPVDGTMHNRIGVGPTFRRFGSMMAFDALRYVFLKEFGPDIKHLILRK